MIRFLLYSLSSLLLLLLVATTAVFYIFWEYGKDLPDHETLLKYDPPTVTRVYAGDGRLMAEYASEQRVFVPVSAMPAKLILAFIATEDKNFFTHKGVDFVALLRASIGNIRNYLTNKRLHGASTITQQVAKNFLLTNEFSLTRKIKEAILSFRIERALSKERIMELYLNEIYLGRRSYGVAVAALNYFNKSLDELALHEMAYLAALPKGPNNYQLPNNFDAAMARRNWILGRMADEGFISDAELKNALSQPLKYYPRARTDFVDAKYYLEDVRKEAALKFGTDLVNEGGLSVHATIESDLQNTLAMSLRQGLLAYDKRHGYRGPLVQIDASKIDINTQWNDILKELQQKKLSRISNPLKWDMAMILSMTDDKAEIGVRAYNNDNGDGIKGYIAIDTIRWARKSIADNKRSSKKVNKIADVLQVGDVVWVERQKDDDILDTPHYILQQAPIVEGGAIAIDPHTGHVLAMSGGWDFEKNQFNRATQAMRQLGSAFKPFVYLAGLENGLTPISQILDAPFVLDQPDGKKWRPANFSKKFYGLSPLYLGVEKSRNLMTVRLAQFLGMDVIRDYAQKFNIQENMPLQLSMSLGAGESTLLNITSAYAMLVNGGKKIQPTFINRIQLRNGKTIYKHDLRECKKCGNMLPSSRSIPKLPDLRPQIASPQASYQTVTMLERVVEYGTGKHIRDLNIPLAGKTGTTNDSRDAWFIGFAPDLAVGVFVGFDTPIPLGHQTNGLQETGSSVAAPIFKEIMRGAFKGRNIVPFRVPNDIVFMRIDSDTNKLANEKSKRVTQQAFLRGDVTQIENNSIKHINNGDAPLGTSFSLEEEAQGLY